GGGLPHPRLLRLFAGLLRPWAPPAPGAALGAAGPPLPPQQGPDPPVAVARVLTHQFQHPRHQPPFLLGGCLRPLPLRRALLPQHATGAPFRGPESLLEEAHGLPPLRGRQNFFCTTSWSICLSRANSATRRFSRAFSASSSLSLLASSCLRPPYWLHQRWKVCSLTPRRWQTWARPAPWARSASAWRSLMMTSSAVCRFTI